MLKAILQGKLLGHPLHPMLVHFPIGLYVLSLVLDVASFAAADGQPFVRAAFYALLFGEIMALAAAVPGFVDWADIRPDHRAKKIGAYHMALNLVVVGLYGVGLVLRWGAPDRPRTSHTPWLPLALSAAALLILTVSGYLGGHMVYDDGIAVGRHRRRGATPRTLHVSRGVAADTTAGTTGVTAGTPAAEGLDGFVAVAGADLADGQTLRVEVDGTAVAVARVGGEYFAFQDFCTHRYGPLSEGCFQGHEVTCPWHRSRFDLRTGRVTHGPAKVDIKTFAVAVRDGRIWLGPERPPPQPEVARAGAQEMQKLE